jgi:hypothetical protein
VRLEIVVRGPKEQRHSKFLVNPGRQGPTSAGARFVKGGRLRGIWEALVHTTLKEWLIAFVLAVIVAMILDLFKVAGSHLRDFGRFLKNKAAEQSVARLRSRIKELEKYKASLTLFMSSDKAHYLNAFRILLGTLLVCARRCYFS